MSAKNVTRSVLPILRVLLSALLLLGAGATTASGQGFEVKLLIWNDALTNSSKPDDLYTFGLAVNASRGRWTFELEERAFTDRIGGRRMDETYLTARTAWPVAGRWLVETGVGVAHVGRGLLGESVQNSVHRALGSDQLHLQYTDTDAYHGHVQVAASRTLDTSDGFDLAPWVGVEWTPGFRHSTAIGARWSWLPAEWLRLQGALGGRYTESSSTDLAPWIEDFDATVEVQIQVLQRFVATWSYNAYGTADQHFHLGIRLKQRASSVPPIGG